MKPYCTVIDLDVFRGYEDGSFVCLFEDCKHKFMTETPIRKNALHELCCPRCGRDFFCMLRKKKIEIHWGEDYFDLVSAWIDKQKKRRK